MVYYIDGIEVRKIKSYASYGVSKCGRAFRLDTKRELKIVEHGGVEGDRYLVFRVSEEGKASKMYLHKAIAEAWIPNENPLRIEVNHKDGNKKNYSLDNLEWVTLSENQRHAIDTGLKPSGESLYNSSLTNQQVHEICKRLEINPTQINALSSEYNTTPCVIRKLRSGSTYFSIRSQYNIAWSNKNNFGNDVVVEVCKKIDEGMSDKKIADSLSDKGVTTISVKRIRYGIDFKDIANHKNRPTFNDYLERE